MSPTLPEISHKFSFPVFVVLLAAISWGAPSSQAQAAAETAGATSTSATTAAAAAKPLTIPPMPSAENKAASPHLEAASGPPPQVVNRRAMEEHAGHDAGKLLIRSSPPTSQVWINDKFVGSTPMLLVVAPGKYRVTFRGSRSEFGERVVDLLPRETRELALTLSAHYPTRVTVH